MKKSNKQFLDSLKAVIHGDDDLKRERIKMLINSGFFTLSEKDKESLLKDPKPTKRKKSNAEAEEKTI